MMFFFSGKTSNSVGWGFSPIKDLSNTQFFFKKDRRGFIAKVKKRGLFFLGFFFSWSRWRHSLAGVGGLGSSFAEVAFEFAAVHSAVLRVFFTDAANQPKRLKVTVEAAGRPQIHQLSVAHKTRNQRLPAFHV